MNQKEVIISKVFEKQGSNGCWKMLDADHKYYPVYQHYVPNFKATLWTLILLADLELDPTDERVLRPLETIKNHFFDFEQGIYSLGNDHFPIPCLNGNLIYLDAYFNPSLSEKSLSSINFFSKTSVSTMEFTMNPRAFTVKTPVATENTPAIGAWLSC